MATLAQAGRCFSSSGLQFMRGTYGLLLQESHSFHNNSPDPFYLNFWISLFPRLRVYCLYFSFPTRYSSCLSVLDLCNLVLFLISDYVYWGDEISPSFFFFCSLEVRILICSLLLFLIMSGIAATLSVYKADSDW